MSYGHGHVSYNSLSAFQTPTTQHAPADPRLPTRTSVERTSPRGAPASTSRGVRDAPPVRAATLGSVLQALSYHHTTSRGVREAPRPSRTPRSTPRTGAREPRRVSPLLPRRHGSELNRLFVTEAPRLPGPRPRLAAPHGGERHGSSGRSTRHLGPARVSEPAASLARYVVDDSSVSDEERSIRV